MRLRPALITTVVLGVAIAIAATPASAKPQTTPHTTTAVADDRDATRSNAADVRSLTFKSESLDRAMPYAVYLPPDYGKGTRRYPVLYMLHGMGGSYEEWQSYGLFDRADALIRSGQLQPLIIVTPQGDRAYWVDHAAGDREAWGRYMAKDVVADVDARFRTIADGSHRAIGGLSMGAHGAVQLAMNYPGTFTVVGAHSLVLRRYDTAPAYFGKPTDYAARDPLTMARSKTDLLRGVDLWIDIGDRDPWVGLAKQFNNELCDLKVTHAWHEWSGDHSSVYWRSHLDDYLRFYGDALGYRTRLLHQIAPGLSSS